MVPVSRTAGAARLAGWAREHAVGRSSSRRRPGLDPADNRARLHDLVPSDSDLVVLPEAFARDFGEAGSDVSAYAEPLDGAVRDRAGRRSPRSATPRWSPGCSRPREDPARPYNTLVVRGAATASYRKIHLYDSFGYRESDRLTAGPLEPVRGRGRRASGSG